MPPSVACALVDTSTGNHRPCGFSCAFSCVEDEAGLDLGGPRLRVEREQLAQVLAAVDDQRRAGRLAALAGAGAARQHRHAEVAGDVDRGGDVVLALRGTNTPTGITW